MSTKNNKNKNRQIINIKDFIIRKKNEEKNKRTELYKLTKKIEEDNKRLKSIINKTSSDILDSKEDLDILENDIELEKRKNLYVEENKSRTYEISYQKDVYSFYIYIGIIIISLLVALYFVISIFF